MSLAGPFKVHMSGIFARGEVCSSLLINVTMQSKLCAYHGAHRHLTSRYAHENDDYYIAKKLYKDPFRKENLAASLCESTTTYLHPPLKESFEWFYEHVGELTQTPNVKDAFAHLVFYRHKGKGSQTTCLHVGCSSCQRMSPPLYYSSDTLRHQVTAHNIFWDFLSPYHDVARRVEFWQQYYYDRELERARSLPASLVPSEESSSASSEEQPRPQEQPPQGQQPPQPIRYWCYWENVRQVESVLPPLSLMAPEPSELPSHNFELHHITQRRDWPRHRDGASSSSSSQTSAGPSP